MAGVLDHEVVVISGVTGSVPRWRIDAREGADLVLAARTIERLDDLAEDELKGAGHEAVAVRTDITDDAEVNGLVEAAGDLRQGRRAGQQCVRVPSMKPAICSSLSRYICCLPHLPRRHGQRSGSQH